MIVGAAAACGIETTSRVPMWSNVPPGADPFGASVAARYLGGPVAQASAPS
ncbi:hypothetical protein ACIG0C_10120 [Kitasatospora aureofaciens]|uniref:Uncharacterized protein n=1 Tax=Kitasatospora aureofaciens TaxID=1894 RepID=A0A8H9HC42_KITAU|nr:hypothetical protein [Kitasatospora aureofaciens]UKZ09240.1 hypothetical protein BOQ63_035505 [Streptomyces viridifaciens]GGU55419.1 hypothetical protein GCM10010502_01990 [Kitasatospora aureofaciens]